MSDQRELMPTGLTRPQFATLTQHAEAASKLDLETLQRSVQSHLEETHRAYEINRLVNARLAEAICDSISQVVLQWEEIPPIARNWLGGAMLYFVESDDEDSDFKSPTGFEDDAEILNSCLRFAGFEEYCLNVEDYDDA